MKQKGFIYLGLRLAMYVAVVGAIFYFVYHSPYNPHPESAEDIRKWVAGFGTFKVKERAERSGRNPRTNQAITIKATKLPTFVPGKSLKDAVAED